MKVSECKKCKNYEQHKGNGHSFAFCTDKNMRCSEVEKCGRMTRKEIFKTTSRMTLGIRYKFRAILYIFLVGIPWLFLIFYLDYYKKAPFWVTTVIGISTLLLIIYIIMVWQNNAPNPFCRTPVEGKIIDCWNTYSDDSLIHACKIEYYYKNRTYKRIIGITDGSIPGAIIDVDICLEPHFRICKWFPWLVHIKFEKEQEKA